LLIKEYLNAGLNLSISLNHVRKSSIIGVRCVQFIPKNKLLFLGIYFLT
jgi:hypothetical protein